MAVNVVGIRTIYADQVMSSANVYHVNVHKNTVRFKAASASGPGDVESRDVWVTLSLADVVVMLSALPAPARHRQRGSSVLVPT
jgi:hypothetical protein